MVRALCVAYLAVLAFGAGTASSAGPLITGVSEPLAKLWSEPEARLVYQRISATGSGVVKIWVEWRLVAPNRPLDAGNPADPAYRWDPTDREVRLAREAGLKVILTLYESPQWAETTAGPEPGSGAPATSDFALFAEAVAKRYNGDFDPDGLGPQVPLPEVLKYEIWNEPNLTHFLWPQYDSAGGSMAPDIYRAMVNAAASAIHGVDPRNRVAVGATAPFGTPGQSHEPLDFMRKLLCLSPNNRPTCSARTQADAWSHHPYTQGGPTHSAFSPGNVSLGDLPEMRAVLRAAIRSGRIVSTMPVEFWVTEFSWDTRPPDPMGLPPRLHARWTSEALYRAWRSGITLMTWWMLRDQPMSTSYAQSGFYFCGAPTSDDDSVCETSSAADVRKRSLRAFRFPFVTFREGPARINVWGRTPSGQPGLVVVQQRVRARWIRIGRLRAPRGVFQATYRGITSNAPVRARFLRSGELSLPFSLRKTPDRSFPNVFGCGGPVPCSRPH
jgi:hypothetical protein